jgi:hypothetical protein
VIDPGRDALEAVWHHFADDDPRYVWDPRRADGCWPNDCTCGFVAAMEKVRTALKAYAAAEAIVLADEAGR